MMKKIRSIFSLSLVALFVGACQPASVTDGGGENSESTAENKTVEERGWLENYEEALAQAKESNRPILANFTGSDWCPPCIQMRKRVLSTDEFAAFAGENLILLELDYPTPRVVQTEEIVKQNEKLIDRYGVEAFPTFIILDSEGKELRRVTGFQQGGTKGFLKWIGG